jgi:itaconyl-CoA hydratase
MTIVTRGFNQNKIMVCTFKRSMLIPGRGFAVEDTVGHY